MQQTIAETQTLSIASHNECHTYKQTSSHNSTPLKYSVSWLFSIFFLKPSIHLDHFVVLQEFWQRSPVFKERTQKQKESSSFKLLPITGKNMKISAHYDAKIVCLCVCVCVLAENWKCFTNDLFEFFCDRFIIFVACKWWKRHRQSRILKFNCSKYQFDHTNVIFKSTANFAVTEMMLRKRSDARCAHDAQ